jgi:hypothetical protein
MKGETTGMDKKIRNSLRHELRSPSLLEGKIPELLEAKIVEQMLLNHSTVPPEVALQVLRDAEM